MNTAFLLVSYCFSFFPTSALIWNLSFIHPESVSGDKTSISQFLQPESLFLFFKEKPSSLLREKQTFWCPTETTCSVMRLFFSFNGVLLFCPLGTSVYFLPSFFFSLILSAFFLNRSVGSNIYSLTSCWRFLSVICWNQSQWRCNTENLAAIASIARISP